jgi:CP family cyanate transporter-like MFS transporter
VLVALSLRTAVAALSPIVDHITLEVPLDHVALGVIGAAPPIAFAVAGLLAPLVARRVGLERALLIAIGTMVVGHLGRALAPDTVLLVVATVVTLFGVGLGNVLLPPTVKRYFPDRVGLVTAVYATILSISTAVPALIAVPVADAAGWRISLGVWFVIALTAAIPWIPLVARRRAVEATEQAAPPVVDAAHDADSDESGWHENAVETGAVDIAHAEAARTEAAVGRPREPGEHGAPRESGDPGDHRLGLKLLRSPTAWGIMAIFAVSGVSAYAAFAWFPAMLVDQAGVTEAEAGTMLFVFAIMGFPCSLLVPVIAARVRNVAPLVLAGTTFSVIGYLGLMLAPTAAPWAWVAIAGLGPLFFPLALVLINLRSRTASGTIALSGFVQGFGYVIGAGGPLVVGLLHDATGEWTAPLWFLLAVIGLSIPAAIILSRPRYVEDEVEHAAR